VTVPSGFRLQETKLKASAINKIAAFRMTSYIQRLGCPQVCCLIATLAIFSLPLAGGEATQTPILIPLATKLVPLGTSLESAPVVVFQFPELAGSAKIPFGPLPRVGFEPNIRAGAPNIPIVRLPDLGQIDVPHGRSPPAT
jgi:hypothetical protein